MHKVLLVIDEFTELETIESLLKRLGFDVLALGKEVLLNDALLGFQPELVMASYKSKNVDGIRVASKVKAPKSATSATHVIPRVALIWQTGMPSPQMTRESAGVVDALIEAPLHPLAIIQIVSRLLNLPEEQLVKKFERIGNVPPPKSAHQAVSNLAPAAAAHVLKENREWDPVTRPGQSATAVSSRSERYLEFLRVHPDVVDQVLPRDKTQAEIRKLKASESKEERAEIDRINAEKRAFTVSLFRKKK